MWYDVDDETEDDFGPYASDVTVARFKGKLAKEYKEKRVCGNIIHKERKSDGRKKFARDERKERD